MKLFLQPNDTFFFRDGKPFTKGDQSEGHSIFPPLPSTVLGSLRTAYIAEFGNLPLFYSEGMKDIIGTSESLCNAIQLRCVFMASSRQNRLEVFFPVPLDLIYKKSDEQNRNIPLHLLSSTSKTFASNGAIDCPLTWSTPESIDSEADGLLSLGHIKRYLQGNTANLLLTSKTMLIEKESKTGITRSKNTLSSEDHMLYRIDMSRFKNSDGNYGFFVDYECTKDLPQKGLLKLGGEGKSFVYEHNNFDINQLFDHLASIKTTLQSTGRFKLYFATPAIFHEGWLPSWLDSDALSGKYPIPDKSPISLKLITAAVGKPISIGGWNMAKGETETDL